MNIMPSLRACALVFPILIAAGGEGCSPSVDFGSETGGASGAGASSVGASSVGASSVGASGAGASSVGASSAGLGGSDSVAGRTGASIGGSAACVLDTTAASGGGLSASTDADEAGADAAGAGSELEACPCTRRPGVGQSTGAGIFQACALGRGVQTTVTITPEGGTYSMSGDAQQFCGGQANASGVNFELIVPPGAVSVATTLILSETRLPPPEAFVDGSPIFSIEPAGVQFAVPVALNVPYGALGGVQPSFSIYTSADDGITYTRAADSYQNAGFMQGSTKQTGLLFVGTPKTAAQRSCP